MQRLVRCDTHARLLVDCDCECEYEYEYECVNWNIHQLLIEGMLSLSFSFSFHPLYSQGI